ncbi:MAG: transcriptional regulator [Chloroflexota bacterium]|nr:transcriptional regulator [Chloroflexota bacterium]
MATESRSYGEILSSKLPHPIHNDDEANRVREEIQSLVRTYPRTDGEEGYLSLLGQLLIAWESGRYTAPNISGVEVLRCMLEDNGVKQSELVGPVFASPGIVSEILSGKRQLTLSHIQKLGAFFHMSPAIFVS